MAELLGIGCTHAPMILFPPEHWVNVRKRLSESIPNYVAPPQLIEQGPKVGTVGDHQHVCLGRASLCHELRAVSGRQHGPVLPRQERARELHLG